MKKFYYPICVACLLVSLAAAGCSSDPIPAFEENADSSGGDNQGATPGKPGVSDPQTGETCEDTCKATCCDGVCRDTQSNVKHCGECGHACDDNEICEGGKCIPQGSGSCPENEALCGDSCVSIVNNPEHCGSCDNACGPGEICIDRACALDCGGLAHCNDSCVDLLTNGENCGKCGNSCPEGQACINGSCSDKCAVESQVICDHDCSDLQIDPKHCGSCETSCPENEICVDGSCSGTCSNESELVCNHQCVNLQTHAEFCGSCDTACLDNARCVDGNCVENCDIETDAICKHVCINIKNDRANCGGCDIVCTEKEICQDGVCSCPEDKPNCNDPDLVCENANEMPCGDVCVDLKNDKDNCGACGQSCGENGICQKGKCIDCTGKTPCEDGICYDTQNDPQNCGGCGIACPANIECKEGTCASCLPDYVDCDGNPENGCEKTTAECACKNGEEKSCYYGPAGTEGKGACKAGKMTCTNNKWGACEGMVVPVNDFKCRNTESSPAKNDLNCDGKVDGTEDWDGDGYSICTGDCCDSKEHCPSVSDPTKVRPGFYEVAGNKIDDNCNGQVDEGATTCSATYSQSTDLSNAANRNNAGVQLARAMDICDDASTMGYGLVSATVQTLVSGTPGNAQMGQSINVFPYLSKTGSSTPIISPRKGSHFAGIATGAFVSGSVGGGHLAGGIVPNKYLSEHGGQLQSAPGCPSGGTSINDTVNLHLELKAPVNATGFSFEFRFFSHEYWYYLCDRYNDFFLVLLDSKAAGIPKDGNIAFDKVGNPVSVNNAFFTACQSPSCNSYNFSTSYTTGGCPNSLTCKSGLCVSTYGACPDGTGDVCAFDSSCGSSMTSGGATAWLKTSAPVVGGETFKLDFYIWDTSDSAVDSAAIIDNFQWITTGGSVTVGTDFADPRT